MLLCRAWSLDSLGAALSTRHPLPTADRIHGGGWHGRTRRPCSRQDIASTLYPFAEVVCTRLRPFPTFVTQPLEALRAKSRAASDLDLDGVTPHRTYLQPVLYCAGGRVGTPRRDELTPLLRHFFRSCIEPVLSPDGIYQEDLRWIRGSHDRRYRKQLFVPQTLYVGSTRHCGQTHEDPGVFQDSKYADLYLPGAPEQTRVMPLVSM
nr:hypothetical protein CFP56_03878 [Quercus suber]